MAEQPTVMVFDREAQASLVDGVWRDYDGGIKTKIRPLTKQLSRSFREQASRSGRFDQEAFDKLFWDHLIADWNVPEAVKEKGEIVGTKPMPCTVDNKLMVTAAWQNYHNWVMSEADTLGEKLSKVEKKQLGNLSGSPAGKRTDLGKETSSSAATAAK